MPTTAWERLEQERWDETLVSEYVRNGRYSPTRPLWRPPRLPTPHRALQSSEEEEEEEQPIIVIDSDEDEVDEQNETIVISDSEEEETPEPPRPAGFILEEVSPPETPPQATPQQATPPPPIPQETPPQTTPQQATAPPPTPPETSMDADEEWRPIRLPARSALQLQVSEPAPPPPQKPTLQRQKVTTDACDANGSTGHGSPGVGKAWQPNPRALASDSAGVVRERGVANKRTDTKDLTPVSICERRLWPDLIAAVHVLTAMPHRSIPKGPRSNRDQKRDVSNGEGQHAPNGRNVHCHARMFIYFKK
ncbi:uncharacterized protein Dmoj_GI27097 [Drosophila mojavensis]|uniref:Uncharacterized protein n=1 Tax=Drosophila mojavensis TaxID=7230 RepID=A0A0Q9XFH3_DROMO|nr:uncharacterized protein Dmoj_GI27097 [Drosophila mojavensis]